MNGLPASLALALDRLASSRFMLAFGREKRRRHLFKSAC
jgi:hypothetical protein